jgi:DNA-binding transcriptional LysR family regulator
MNDRALRYFLAVVRAGSIRGAAAVLHVAASAVSRQVAEMEAACGTPLLERLPRGVVPTEAGRIIAEHARRQADEAALLQDRLQRLRGAQRGLVRIRCGAGFLPDLMRHGLAGFSAAHPGITFQVVLGTSDPILKAVAEGEADLGLAYNPQAHPEVDAALVTRQPLVALLPAGHALASQRRPLLLRRLAAEPVALLPADHGIRQMISRVEADGGFRLLPVLETDSFELQRRFVAARMGVAFLPRFALAPEEAGEMTAVPLADPLLAEAAAHLVVRAGRRLPEAAERLRDWLAKHLVCCRPG